MSRMKPLLVGVAGGSASGKTSLCEVVFQRIGVSECTILSLDNFYKECTDEQMKNIGKYNFDHPDAFDWDLAYKVLKKLTMRQDVTIPRYNYQTCKRDEPGILVKSTDLILFEGIFALINSELRDLMDLKVFVDTDSDIRLLRRIARDTVERGREIEGVLKSYNRFVRQAYIDFIKPTMRYSDLIVPHGVQNDIALQFISENLKNKLLSRGILVKEPREAAYQSFRIMFDVVDDVLINYQKYSKHVYSIKDQFRHEMKLRGDTPDMQDKLQHEMETMRRQLSRMIIDQDDGRRSSPGEDSAHADIMAVHFEFFAKRLLSTFSYFNQTWQEDYDKSKSQPDTGGRAIDVNDEKDNGSAPVKKWSYATKDTAVPQLRYIFVNQEPSSWNRPIEQYYERVHESIMDDLEDDSGVRYENHVCIFFPEIVSLGSSKIERHAILLNNLVQACPQISKVHILTFFMTGQCLTRLEQLMDFNQISLYPVFLNNELCQYHCLYSDNKTTEETTSVANLSQDGGIDEKSDLNGDLEKTDHLIAQKSKSCIQPGNQIGSGLKEKKKSPFDELAAAKAVVQDDEALSLRRLSSHSGVNAVAANLLSPEKNITHQEPNSPADQSVKDSEMNQEGQQGTLDSIRCFRAFYQNDVFMK